MRQLAVADGFCDLGMWLEANDALDELPPQERGEIPALVIRARIYRGLGYPDKAAVIKRAVEMLGGVMPENLPPG